MSESDLPGIWGAPLKDDEDEDVVATARAKALRAFPLAGVPVPDHPEQNHVEDLKGN